MPIYSFESKETGEQYDMSLTYNEMIKYLEDHPDINQVFKMNLVDPVGIGVTKPPSDFQKYVIGKVKEVPGAHTAAIEKRWHIPKEV
jgi:hypothetical protein